MLDHPQFPHKPLPHQSPAFGPIIYKFIVLDPLGLNPHPSLGPTRRPRPYNWHRLWEELLVRWWVQWFVKAGSSPLGEVMVASLLYHKGRTARWFTAQRASGTMCVALAPTRGQTPANLVVGPVRPRLRGVAAARSNSRGLYSGTSSGR